MAKVDVEFLVTHKPKKSDVDPTKFNVEIGEGAAAEAVFSHAANPKAKKGKKNVEASPKAKVDYEHPSYKAAPACDVELGANITRVRVLLSPLGIGQKLRLELKAWSGASSKSKTVLISRKTT